MKKKIYPLFFIYFLFSFSIAEADDSWKNFYGAIWNGGINNEAVDGVTYCKQMGYDYIAVRAGSINKTRYLTNSNRDGLKFYIINPKDYSNLDPNTLSLTHDIAILNVGTMSANEKAYYNNNFAWITGTTTFPLNLAPGWWTGTATFRPIWDIQQQRVIDLIIPQIMSTIKQYENNSVNFKFAGVMYDIPILGGELNYLSGTTNIATNFNHWNGTDSSILHDSITHDYATYSDANAAFYKQLKSELSKEYPGFKTIHEPYYLWNSSALSDWINQISTRSDKNEIVGDMLFQESAGTEFVGDARNFNSGVNVNYGMVGSSQAFKVEQNLNRLYAGVAGTSGAWYNYFGTWGNRGTMPNFASLTAIYPRLKLVRVIPNWDNLNGIGTATRSYINDEYNATHTTSTGNTVTWSHIGTYTMFSRHWKRPNEIFVVKMGTDTELYEPVVIHSNEYIQSIYSTDGLFQQVSDVKDSQWTQNGSSWNINAGIVTGTNTDGGLGYIMKVYPVGSYNTGSTSIRNTTQ